MGATIPADDSPSATTAQSVSEDVEHRKELARKFVRLARRQFYVSPSEPRIRHVFADRGWPAVERAMRMCGLIVDKVISKRGTGGSLMTLTVDPETVLMGEDAATTVQDSVRCMWW
jgi:hypothetical protein